MNKEQQELLVEAYENFVNVVDEKWQKSDVGDLDDFIYDGLLIDGYDDKGKWFARIPTQEEFIYACKIYPKFSQKWGLKIEERELIGKERVILYEQKTNIDTSFFPVLRETLNFHNIPTKLITITYNDKTIVSYE